MDIRKCNINDLEEMKKYSKEIIDILRNKKYKELKNYFSVEDFNDKDLLLPIFYAIKNEYDTYIIFKYLGESLQQETEVSEKVVIHEPELIDGTTLSNNKEFIKKSIQLNPNVMEHASEELKNDVKFVNECININPEVKNQVKEELIENSEVLKNENTIINIIIENPEKILLCDSEIKDNYEIIKQICIENNQVIDYISDNAKQFEKQGLKATQNVLTAKFYNEAIDGFKQQLQDSKEGKSIYEEERLKRHIKFIEKLKNRVDEGKISQAKVARDLQVLCSNLEPQYKKMIGQFLNIDEAILEKEAIEEKEKKEDSKDKKQMLINSYEERKIDETDLNQAIKIIKEEQQKDSPKETEDNTRE